MRFPRIKYEYDLCIRWVWPPSQWQWQMGGVGWNALRKETCHVILVVHGILGRGPFNVLQLTLSNQLWFLAPAKKTVEPQTFFKELWISGTLVVSFKGMLQFVFWVVLGSCWFSETYKLHARPINGCWNRALFSTNKNTTPQKTSNVFFASSCSRH